MKYKRPGISQRTAAVALALGALTSLTACSKKAPPDRPAGLPSAPAGTGTAPLTTSPPGAGSPATPQADDETVPAAPDPRASVSGTVTLPAARRKDVAKTDIIYIIARRAGGPPGPGSMLAVQKHPVGEFPMPFTLSARDAMVPGTPFEGAVDITVRLDKDGDALTRRKGDLLGQVNGVKVGAQGVPIPLDTVQTEDRTLTGPTDGKMPAHGQGHGGPPPGMPPGHP